MTESGTVIFSLDDNLYTRPIYNGYVPKQSSIYCDPGTVLLDFSSYPVSGLFPHSCSRYFILPFCSLPCFSPPSHLLSASPLHIWYISPSQLLLSSHLLGKQTKFRPPVQQCNGVTLQRQFHSVFSLCSRLVGCASFFMTGTLV